MVNKNFNPISHDDLGVSEDEFSNFIIDLYSQIKNPQAPPPRQYEYAFYNPETGEIETGVSDVPIGPVTVKLNSF